MFEDVVMKRVASPLYIAQHLKLQDHYEFMHVIGPYGFVPFARITSFLTILNPLK